MKRSPEAAAGKNFSVVGSATLVRSLLRDDLPDELQILVHPIVVGRGKRLFEDGDDQKALKVADAKTFRTGVVSVTCQPAGIGSEMLTCKPRRQVRHG